MPTTESKLLDKQAVEEIEARANAATEGDWTIRGASWTDGGVKLAGYGIRFVESSETYSGWDARTNFPPETPEGRQASADRSFLARAREDIPALCRTVKHLWAENEQLRRDNSNRQTHVEERDSLLDSDSQAAGSATPTTPLLQKIVEIADIGSAQEFGDAVERLRSIRGLIVGENV